MVNKVEYISDFRLSELIASATRSRYLCKILVQAFASNFVHIHVHKLTYKLLSVRAKKLVREKLAQESVLDVCVFVQVSCTSFLRECQGY